MNGYRKAMQQYAVFQGRARRSEYWLFYLVYLGITLLFGVIEGVLSITGSLTTLVALVHLLPALGVSVRRLHDHGRSGWWLLVALLPVLGWLLLLYFMLQRGDAQANRFGPSPD